MHDDESDEWGIAESEEEWRETLEVLLNTGRDPRGMGYGSPLNRVTREPHETLSILRMNARAWLWKVENFEADELTPAQWDMLEIERRIRTLELMGQAEKRPAWPWIIFSLWRERLVSLQSEVRRCDEALIQRSRQVCPRCFWDPVADNGKFAEPAPDPYYSGPES